MQYVSDDHGSGGKLWRRSLVKSRRRDWSRVLYGRTFMLEGCFIYLQVCEFEKGQAVFDPPHLPNGSAIVASLRRLTLFTTILEAFMSQFLVLGSRGQVIGVRS